MTNILHAIYIFSKNIDSPIKKYSKSKNTIQTSGETLEYYIKDLFCNCIAEIDIKKKDHVYTKYFSYLGNANNPPDFILKDSDAIEVKKLEGNADPIALNSSFPKNKLFSTDPLITDACKNCENYEWESKTLIYAIGTLKKNTQILDNLWFIEGECYAAEFQVYQRIKDTLSSGINSISDVELSETNELGRVNRVDPLGITYLRIRGMWGIEHPSRVFSYIHGISANKLNCILTKDKYNSLPEEDKKNLSNESSVIINEIQIKNPNNPAKLTPAIHIYIKRKQDA